MVSIVNRIIQKGGKIDAIRKDGGHAMGAAAQEGHLQVPKPLVEKDPNFADKKRYDGRTPFAAAAKKGIFAL